MRLALVSETDATSRVADMAGLGFVPIPALKTPQLTPPSQMPDMRRDETRMNIAQQLVSPPTQTAYVLPLSRPQQTNLPSPATIEMTARMQEEKEATSAQETLETVIASAQDIIPLPNEEFHNPISRPDGDDGTGREDFAATGREASPVDFAEIDRATIRTIIAEAMVLADADQQMVASITPRTTPKADKPRLDELGKLIAQDKAQRQRDASSGKEEIHQIPELVFVSGLRKGEKHPPIATLGGRAINFPPVARISGYD